MNVRRKQGQTAELCIVKSGIGRGVLVAFFTTFERFLPAKRPDRPLTPCFSRQRTLRELKNTAQSARALVDYLESHPESLVQGKGAAVR